MAPSWGSAFIVYHGTVFHCFWPLGGVMLLLSIMGHFYFLSWIQVEEGFRTYIAFKFVGQIMA